jgi:hypothetical protein
MKTIKSLLTVFLLLVIVTGSAQNKSGVDSTGLPGDNFSLQGALQMFQKASSLEDFEKMINTESNNVNNLDLNADGETDYVRVEDKMEKDLHAIILRVPVSETESQDIAVIEIEKTNDSTAVLQIIGDDEIYGEEVIVEPGEGEDGAFINMEEEAIMSGPNAPITFSYLPKIVINVWGWPSVRYVYAPLYRPWISPWRWRSYPAWWKPWRPFAWHVWHPRCVVHHRSFSVVHTHRVVRAHTVYRPYRTSSVTVRTRHSAQIGNYRVTRTKTTVARPGGNTTIKKTTVKGPAGGKRTKVKVRKH